MSLENIWIGFLAVWFGLAFLLLLKKGLKGLSSICLPFIGTAAILKGAISLFTREIELRSEGGWSVRYSAVDSPLAYYVHAALFVLVGLFLVLLPTIFDKARQHQERRDEALQKLSER